MGVGGDWANNNLTTGTECPGRHPSRSPCLVIIDHALLPIDANLLEWKVFVDEFLTGTSSLQACDLCALHKVTPPPFKKKLGRPLPLPASTLKTSIMWSSNQLSHILHSSCVRSRQRVSSRGFLPFTAARLPLPPHNNMSVPPTPTPQDEHVVLD